MGANVASAGDLIILEVGLGVGLELGLGLGLELGLGIVHFLIKVLIKSTAPFTQHPRPLFYRIALHCNWSGQR